MAKVIQDEITQSDLKDVVNKLYVLGFFETKFNFEIHWNYDSEIKKIIHIF